MPVFHLARRNHWAESAVIKDPRTRLLWRNRWHQMKRRCLDPHHPRYPSYGGRGIAVSPVFLAFDDFARFIMTLPGWELSGRVLLDRTDNDGPYGPENIRLVSDVVSVANRRRRKLRRLSLPSGATAGNWRFTGETKEHITRLRECDSRSILYRLVHCRKAKSVWASASRIREIGFHD